MSDVKRRSSEVQLTDFLKCLNNVAVSPEKRAAAKIHFSQGPKLVSLNMDSGFIKAIWTFLSSMSDCYDSSIDA